MVKITCRAIDCIFWEDGHCVSDKIIYDPEEGCLTYELLADVIDDDDWDGEDLVDELDVTLVPEDDDILDDPFDTLDDEW